MIRLTRLNSQSLVVNADLIKFIEEAPDTLITLTNGEKFMVRENAEEVIKLIIEFRQALFKAPPQSPDYLLSARPQAALTSGASKSIKHQSER
jgi:flagellar protein FlbD